MTKKRNTKRALLASVLSMMLCATMLIGSTFAWFTDNATTNVNKIEAGTLDIELLDGENGKSLEGETLTFAKAEAGKNEEVLFEPGARYSLQQVWLHNAGNLHAKYQVVISGIDGSDLLAEALDVYVAGEKEGTLADLIANKGVVKEGTIAPDANAIFGTIELEMQTTAGNKYQGLTMDGIGITVRATQDTVEHDSYTDQYDEDAQYQMPLADAEDLLALFDAAATGGSGVVTINLDQDYDGTNWTPSALSNYNGVNTIVINGNGHTIYNLTNPLMIGTFGGAGTVTVNDLVIADANISTGNYNGMGVGAIMAYCDASGGVTMKNCKVVNSEISATGDGGCAGALMGYSSVSANFENCEVSGCTISGTKYAAGVIGTTYGSNVSNAKVTNCTFNNDATYKGVVSGHCLAGQSIFSNTTVSGNNVTALCGRNTVAPIIK